MSSRIFPNLLPSFLGLFLFSSAGFAICEFDGPGNYCKGQAISIATGNMTDFVLVPHSDWIVGISDVRGQKDLVGINKKSSSFIFLTDSTSDEESPSVSPDGSFISYISRANDPLGNVVIAKLSYGKKISINVKDEIKLPNSQESHPSLTNSVVYFASKRVADPSSKIYSKSLNVREISNVSVGDTPVASEANQVVWNQNGRLIIGKDGASKALFKPDGFLRRSASFMGESALTYLRYSADSNGDGKIDSTDAYEVVQVGIKGLETSSEEAILKFGENQVLTLYTAPEKIIVSERTKAGYQLIEYQASERECSLVSAFGRDQYETFISICSAKAFGANRSLEWRYVIRNTTLSGSPSGMTLNRSDCGNNPCDFASILGRYGLELANLLRSKPYSYPTEILIDFALRTKKISSDDAFFLLKKTKELSPYTISRLISAMASSPRYLQNLKYLVEHAERHTAFFASLGVVSHIAKSGNSDLALNQLAFTTREFAKLGLDVSPALKKASELSSEAGLRGLMKIPLQELATLRFSAPWIKERSFLEAKNYLVGEGNDAIAKGEDAVAKASFISALQFDQNSLGAKKGLVQLGVPLPEHDEMEDLLKKTYQIHIRLDASRRSSLAKDLLAELGRFATVYDHESEYYRLLGWLHFQIHLAEVANAGTASGFFNKRLEILGGILGFSSPNHLEEALADLRRAEKIERKIGGISPMLSQDLAIVLFEQGDYKSAFSLSLERVRSISALRFEDAEVASYFLSLASSAAGKMDEHDIAIQLASAAETEARKTNDTTLMKIKKSKVYLYFQAGRYEEAAEEASAIVSVSETGMATRFRLLRVWFLRLAGKLNLSQTEFKAMDLTNLETLKPTIGEDVFQLAKWLQREMTSLPLDKNQILADVNQTQTQVGFFGRITNRVLGNTDIFVSRSKLAIDSAQKLSRAGLIEDAATVLANSRSDLDRVASDVFNRETPLILGYWLDLSLAVFKTRQDTERDMLRFLESADSSCKKIDNGDLNKNCIAIKSAIQSRMNLASASYGGNLDYHASRPFYLSAPEKISLYLFEESAKIEGSGRWVSLVSAQRIEEGLALWAKGVVSGELRGYDLDEVLSYYSRLPVSSQANLNRGLFGGAKLIRLRESLGLDASGMRDYFSKLDFSTKKSLDPSGSFNYLTHEKSPTHFFILDLATSDVAFAASSVRLPVSDDSALKWIPLQVDLANLDSLKPLLKELKSSGKEGGQLTICVKKSQNEEPLSKADIEALDRLYVSTWDYFKGNLFLSFRCLDTEKAEPVADDYFDSIDSSLSDSQFFQAWSEGLTKVHDPKVRSELLDRLSKELVGRKNNTLAYQVLSVLTYLPDRDVSKSFTAQATIASRLKKWDLVKRALERLESYYSSHHVEPALRLDLMRMKAILAESTLKKDEVIAQWQVFIEASKANLDHPATLRGLVSLGNYLLDKVSDFAGAQTYYGQAASFAEQKKLASFEAKFGLAMIKMRSNSFSSALVDLKQLEVDEASTGNDLTALKLNQQLNSALFGLGRLSEASIRQGKTRALFAKLNSTSLRSRYEILDLNLNGMILAKQGWYQLATVQFAKALSLSEESKFPELMSLILANQGFWMRAYGFVEASVKNYEKALQLDDPLDELAISSDKRNLGLATLAAFDLASANRHLTEAEVLSVRLGLDQNLALSRMGLSEVFFKRQNYEEAAKKIDSTISFFLKDYNPEYFWRAVYARSEISRKRGNLPAAQLDLDRALIVALSLPPGQRLGLGPDTTWVDITIRDVVDRWLEFSGARDPDLAAGVIGYFQFREQIDQLTSIPGASQALSDLTVKLAKELRDGEGLARSSDEQLKSSLSSLSQAFRARLPLDTLALWSLKSNVVALRRQGEAFRFYSIPFERSVISRYADFSEKLFAFAGETEILRVSLFDQLLRPIFLSEMPKNLSILSSKEFFSLPLEMLGPEKNHYLGIDSKVNWLLPKIGSEVISRENGFWGGTVFQDLDPLELVKEGAREFKTHMGGKIALDSKIQGVFKFLEVSGHHVVGKDGLPTLALGKGQNYPPLDVFATMPASQSLFLNICGTELGSPLLRAMAAAKGSGQIIDARGAVSELSSFAVSKTLMPLVASGQKIDEALQNARGILANQGKHPSYWARFRAWATY